MKKSILLLSIAMLLMVASSQAQTGDKKTTKKEKKQAEAKAPAQPTATQWTFPFDDNVLVYIDRQTKLCDSLITKSKMPADEAFKLVPVLNYIHSVRDNFVKFRQDQAKALADTTKKK